MHHPRDRIAHTTAFVTPVVEHWLEREIAQWVHPMKDRSDDPSHHEQIIYMCVCVCVCVHTHTPPNLSECLSSCLLIYISLCLNVSLTSLFEIDMLLFSLQVLKTRYRPPTPCTCSSFIHSRTDARTNPVRQSADSSCLRCNTSDVQSHYHCCV